jgi:hypothetical protein
VSPSDYATDDGPTYPEHQIGVPVAMWIGAPPELLKLASTAGSTMQISVVGAEVASARAMVTRHRPRVILLQEDLFDFDPKGFKALAASSGAVLFRLPPGDIGVDVIEVALARSLGRSGARKKR